MPCDPSLEEPAQRAAFLKAWQRVLLPAMVFQGRAADVTRVAGMLSTLFLFFFSFLLVAADT